MATSVQALLKAKIQRYRELRSMLIEQGRPQLEITHVDRHIARIEEIIKQVGSSPVRKR